MRPLNPRWLAALLFCGCGNTVFDKGLPPGEQVDTFAQVTLGKVDVLWIVDNSGSMADKQMNVQTNINSFFHYLTDAQVDYHMAVATTDTTPGHAGVLVSNPTVITSSTPNAQAAFAASVNVGTSGNALDTELDAARLALEMNQTTFIRQDAFLFIIWVSDGVDASYPGDATFFYRFFASLKGKGNDGMVMGGGIVGDPPSASNPMGGCFKTGDGEAPYSDRIVNVVQLLGGVVGSICAPSFAPTLDQLGIQAVGLQRAYKLSVVPDLSTLSVKAKYPCSTDPTYLSTVCTAAPVATACPSASGVLTCDIKKDATPTTGVGWSYQLATNQIYFDTTSLPPKGTTFEVIYYEQGKAPH